ncbi:MAG: hypothetical protein WB723_02900 [Candidatus Acidiferrales bacterium]
MIEDSFPHAFEPDERRGWQLNKNAALHVDYRPQDAVAEVRGNVAWVTVTLHSAWTADTPAGRAKLGGSAWHGTYVETFILVKTPAGIALLPFPLKRKGIAESLDRRELREHRVHESATA